MTDRRSTPKARKGRPPRSRARLAIITVAALLVAGAVGGGAYGIWYLFLQGPGPASVDQSRAAIPSGAAGGSLLTADGTWNIDPAIGSFSDFSDSYVGYRVQEQLASIGANTAVGRTPNVTGSLTLLGTTLTAISVTADLTTLQSDDQRRDGQLRNQGIQTAQFPNATFSLTQPLDLHVLPAPGATMTVTATGDLTLHGVTKSVQIPVTVSLSGDVVEVTGSLPITFSDYGVTPPSSFAVLTVAGNGTMEFQLFFRHT